MLHHWTECILTEKYVCRSQQTWSEVPPPRATNSSLPNVELTHATNSQNTSEREFPQALASSRSTCWVPGKCDPTHTVAACVCGATQRMRIKLVSNLTSNLGVDGDACVLWVTLVLQSEPSSERWSMLLGFQNLGFTLRLDWMPRGIHLHPFKYPSYFGRSFINYLYLIC